MEVKQFHISFKLLYNFFLHMNGRRKNKQKAELNLKFKKTKTCVDSVITSIYNYKHVFAQPVLNFESFTMPGYNINRNFLCSVDSEHCHVLKMSLF